jgi:hypothetical protein
MATKREVLSLKHEYSDADKLEAAAAMAQAAGELDDAKTRETETKAQLKAEVQTAEAALKGWTMKVRNGYDYRPVECEVIEVWAAKLVRTVRMDTGETVSERPMTPSELESGPPLPFDGKPDEEERAETESAAEAPTAEDLDDLPTGDDGEPLNKPEEIFSEGGDK